MDERSHSDHEESTSLLLQWWQAIGMRANRLMQVTYAELQRLTHSYTRFECSGHTLQPTALVHELYIRLFAADPS